MLGNELNKVLDYEVKLLEYVQCEKQASSTNVYQKNHCDDIRGDCNND